jgi:hypothetical protein
MRLCNVSRGERKTVLCLIQSKQNRYKKSLTIKNLNTNEKAQSKRSQPTKKTYKHQRQIRQRRCYKFIFKSKDPEEKT